MATIITRDTGATAVNRPLTNQEIDSNFINLNTAVASNSFTTYTRTAIIASAGQTTFTVAYTIGYLQVYVNGVLLNSTDYTANNTTSVILNLGALAGDMVEIVNFTLLSGSGGNTNIDGGIPSSIYSVTTGQTISGGTPSGI